MHDLEHLWDILIPTINNNSLGVIVNCKIGAMPENAQAYIRLSNSRFIEIWVKRDSKSEIWVNSWYCKTDENIYRTLGHLYGLRDVEILEIVKDDDKFHEKIQEFIPKD